ncbi:complement C5-like isoform X1 [Myxocyprinus asiaticus]|uniref:complement C5-like isoform X1 n=1 Tax=Myxocyprinus asiaticus TaxID=70543 RepID=UPI0022214783|nr:complement C5-like isoform X1 [Myxocyprinus asiaticus]
MARIFWICIFHLLVRNNAAEKSYLITAPKLLRLDASETVVVQLFGYDQETKVDLYLKRTLALKDKIYAVQSLKLNAQNKYQAAATLRIMPQDFPKEDNFVYLQAISGGINEHQKIPVTTVNGFLFIQTDKHLYTPEQEVKVRVYSVNEEQRKSNRPVILTFIDPDGIKVEMIDLTDINGAKPLLPPFKIPLKPTFGIWKIVASYAETFQTTATAEFEVKEYVLPSISLQIVPEANYVSPENIESFPLKISAKYVHGTPVSRAEVFLRFGYRSPETIVMIPSTFLKYEMRNGKLEVSLNIKSALSKVPDGPQQLSDMGENSFLHVTALLQESTGGLSQQAVLSNVKFAQSPFTLSLIATPPFIKPGLPYPVRVLVQDPLGEPVKGVPVKARATITTVNKELEELKFLGHLDTITETSQRDGIAYFISNIPDKVEKAEFKFETADDSWKSAELTLKAESYVSINHRYLHIDLPSESTEFKVGQYINVNIYFHYRDYLSLKTFSYQVISRGKVVQFATVDRVSDKIQSLNIHLTPEMVPSARLLVYYILSGEEHAELVADSVWIDVKANCVNNLNVDLSTLDTQQSYKPKDKLQLRVSTKSTRDESLVALSAVDTALYIIKPNDKDPLKKVLQHVEKSDLGCGRGGGKNNADVFDRAGLMFITNANAKASSAAGVCTTKVRPKRSVELRDKYQEMSRKYGKYKNCCISGAHSSPTLESCEDRARRLNKEFKCKAAFSQCCKAAIHFRKESEDTIILSRAAIGFLMDMAPHQIRSYFPESWLWEEQTISRSGSVSINRDLPDSLTTWELKAVGIFNEGICVSDPKRVQVSQDISMEVPLPYSMVRGEQLELKGSVYNQRTSRTSFTVTLTAPEGVCVFRGTQRGKYGEPHENKGKVEARSVALVMFYIMALEVGTHKLTFTLKTSWGTESVEKMLRVVPEGIRKEILNGKRIDPRGVYGTPIHKLEFKTSLPPKVVPKSSVDRVLIVGGEVLGKLLLIINSPEGLKQLTDLPRGSAEMELMALLPVYYVYHYLESTEGWDILGQEASTSHKELKRKMQAGITSIMSFKLKREFAFSMWSVEDKSASTWVTALIVKTFADMNEYVPVNTDVLTNTIHWLITQCQNNDGSFTEKSKIKPLKLMGSGADVTEETVYLTSYVMIGITNALKIQNVNIEAFKNAIDHAARYLFSKTEKIKNLYVRAIASYALTLADMNSMPAVKLYEELKKEAQIEGDPVTVRFWEDTKDIKDPLKPSKETAKTVETTVYILLNALLRGESSYAKPILNWLTQDQRYGGGLHSTQDTILTLEALTKYSILIKQANLDMVVNIEYRTKGDISRIKLTQQKPVAKPIEVTQNDDIIVKTAMSSGVSFATLRTVYYEMTESDENCQFDTSIDIHDRMENSNDPMFLSQRIVACAKYKPHENAAEREAGLTVMEINLPTGVSPVLEDLDMYQNGLESRISNYEIMGDKVILQIDSIPSDEFYCVGFRIQEDFETGMTSASVFRVYEFYDRANECIKYYYPKSRRLLRLCEGDQCQCMAAECCNFKSTIDSSITIEQRMKDVCKENVKYAFRVLIESSEAAGDFVTYKANVEAVLKKEQAVDLKKDSEIELIKKATCSSTNFEVGKQYLIMTAERMQIQVGRAYKYKFPMDSHAWVNWWPHDCKDDACRQYLNVLNDFEFDFILSGCGDK